MNILQYRRGQLLDLQRRYPLLAPLMRKYGRALRVVQEVEAAQNTWLTLWVEHPTHTTAVDLMLDGGTIVHDYRLAPRSGKNQYTSNMLVKAGTPFDTIATEIDREVSKLNWRYYDGSRWMWRPRLKGARAAP